MSASITATTNRSPNLPDLSLIVQRIKDPSQQARLTGLSENDAQCIADFLSALLDEDDSLISEDKKYLLTLLRKIVKTAQVLPQSYQLQGVQCDFRQAREGGAFADIFQGVYRKRKVCVKTVRIFQRGENDQMLRAFAKEIVLWANLSHENILPFCGIYQELSGRICIVSPWMDTGDLSVYLQNSPNIPRLPLALDITAGLRYLHESNVVHGDLKAKNILVSDHGRALIADFGISRIAVSTKLASTQLSSGTMRWMAPELLKDNGENIPLVTRQSDMWSLGCVYYEIFTRKVPFYHCVNDARLSLVRLDPRATPSRPTNESILDNISGAMWALMKKCWDHEPRSRPYCADVYEFMTGLVDAREQHHSHNHALWKATRGRSGVGKFYKRARRIILEIDDEHHSESRVGYLTRYLEAISSTAVSFGSAISKRLPVESIDEDCFIIAVVGQTGVGKSTFINTAAGDDILDIGHSLKPDMREVHYVECCDPTSNDKRKVVFVDTPGFDSEKEESAIEKRLRSWLKKMSSKKLKIFGILYLHRITDPKLSSPCIRPLSVLRTLLEEPIKGFPIRVILVTTMWGKRNNAQQQYVYESREAELQKYWGKLSSGSVVSKTMRFDKTAESAWKIVSALRGTEEETQ